MVRHLFALTFFVIVSCAVEDGIAQLRTSYRGRNVRGAIAAVDAVSSSNSASGVKPASYQAPPQDTSADLESALDSAVPSDAIAEVTESWHTGCPGCGDAGCNWGCQAGCGRWARFEMLLWWRSARDLPALVTTSPADTALAQAGLLGEATTRILLGNEGIGGDAQPGGRISLGWWLDPAACTGIGGSFFALGDSTIRFSASDADFPILVRPFFNSSTGVPDGTVIAFPATWEGRVDFVSQSDVYGADLHLRQQYCVLPEGRMDWLVGYQHYRIDEDVQIRSAATSIDSGGNIPFETVITTTDRFGTQNEFHGGMLGLSAEFEQGCWSWGFLAKAALGRMHQTVRIAGETITAVPGQAPSQSSAGLLAQPSNSGTFSQDQFLVVPELGLNVGWHLHPCVDLTLGYSFIYWANVVQPGEQIQLNVNPTQVPGPPTGAATPSFQFRETDYWVHGLNLGLSVRY